MPLIGSCRRAGGWKNVKVTPRAPAELRRVPGARRDGRDGGAAGVGGGLFGGPGPGPRPTCVGEAKVKAMGTGPAAGSA